MTRKLGIWEWSGKLESSLARIAKENIVARDISLQLHSHPHIEIDPSHQRKEVGRCELDRVLTQLLKIAPYKIL